MRQTMAKVDPLLQELGVATVAMAGLSALIALLYWFFTGNSPWPFVVLGELAGFGFGVSVLTLTSPRRR